MFHFDLCLFRDFASGHTPYTTTLFSHYAPRFLSARRCAMYVCYISSLCFRIDSFQPCGFGFSTMSGFHARNSRIMGKEEGNRKLEIGNQDEGKPLIDASTCFVASKRSYASEEKERDERCRTPSTTGTKTKIRKGVKEPIRLGLDTVFSLLLGIMDSFPGKKAKRWKVRGGSLVPTHKLVRRSSF